MCGILFHFRGDGLEENDKDYSVIDIQQMIQNDLEATTCEANAVPEVFKANEAFQSLIPKVLSRGSDYGKYLRLDNTIELYSSVLSLRAPFTEQPIVDDSFILQFNGELYNDELDGNDHANDTAFIFQKLKETKDVLKTIGMLEGEFAFTIFDLKDHKVYFGKDLLGKKSLSYSVVNDELLISSCTPSSSLKNEFNECVASKVYIFDLPSRMLDTVSYQSSSVLPKDYVVSDIAFVDDDRHPDILQGLNTLLDSAVQTRIRNIFPLHGSVSKFGILFSGGLDCTVLACLAALRSTPGTVIDLLNVSFYNPRTKVEPSSTPDRQLSLKSWLNLTEMFSKKGVKFQLVEIDVPYEDYMKHRNRVVQMIYPNDTEMDLSIAIAFYFASRGVGNKVLFDARVTDPTCLERVSYESTCKVLLSGLGADELFGGYTRHERIFTPLSNYTKKKIKGQPQEPREFDITKLFQDLRDELQQDLSNLYSRNLARDDKLISSWSKELRYPFLDTHVIDYVITKIPLTWKLHYDEETGKITRKYILRALANSLDLEWVADEAKRAIQFGAKSAKMEVGTGKMKGTDKLSVVV